MNEVTKDMDKLGPIEEHMKHKDMYRRVIDTHVELRKLEKEQRTMKNKQRQSKNL